MLLEFAGGLSLSFNLVLNPLHELPFCMPGKKMLAWVMALI